MRDRSFSQRRGIAALGHVWGGDSVGVRPMVPKPEVGGGNNLAGVNLTDLRFAQASVLSAPFDGAGGTRMVR